MRADHKHFLQASSAILAVAVGAAAIGVFLGTTNSYFFGWLGTTFFLLPVVSGVVAAVLRLTTVQALGSAILVFVANYFGLALTVPPSSDGDIGLWWDVVAFLIVGFPVIALAMVVYVATRALWTVRRQVG